MQTSDNHDFQSTADSFARILNFMSPGVTPFIGAALTSDVELAKKLIDAGQDPNVGVSTKYGSALDVAARIGDSDMCRILIDGGAQVQEKHLLAAIGSCNLAAAQVLLPHYVDACGEGMGGTAVLFGAIESGSADIVNAVLDAPLGYVARLSETPAGVKYSPIGAAINKDAPRVLKLLIARGADVQGSVVVDGVRRPYLDFACLNAGAEVARVLLEAGVDVNAETDGDLPIHTACSSGSHEAIEKRAKLLQVLVDHGADVSSKNKSGRTVMQLVSRIEALRQIVASAKTSTGIEHSMSRSTVSTGMGAKRLAGAEPL